MATPIEAAGAMSRTLADNIEKLRARQTRDAATASLGNRLAARITAFAGSMAFIYLHLAIYGLWIAANLGWLPGVPKFDPSFVILAMEASVEAIFLSTFVLISQNRMAADAAGRADLDLHVSLLTEHEITQMARLIVRLADKLGVTPDDPDFHEIEQDVEPERVLDAIEDDPASRR